LLWKNRTLVACGWFFLGVVFSQAGTCELQKQLHSGSLRWVNCEQSQQMQSVTVSERRGHPDTAQICLFDETKESRRVPTEITKEILPWCLGKKMCNVLL